ncbi:hypothetical protein B0H17DRAFT_1034863, partial [Mycena rosella]
MLSLSRMVGLGISSLSICTVCTAPSSTYLGRTTYPLTPQSQLRNTVGELCIAYAAINFDQLRCYPVLAGIVVFPGDTSVESASCCTSPYSLLISFRPCCFLLVNRPGLLRPTTLRSRHP